MSTQKMIRDVRRMAEDAGLSWAGHEVQGNAHIRIRCIAPDGQEIAATMSATPRCTMTAARKTLSRLRRGIAKVPDATEGESA